ncbi:MAG: hypothetical protein NZ807_06335, partial [Dehalococcoidia bacterium]|nr:hypothetical protein [Dehalococcoidia bacterium]
MCTIQHGHYHSVDQLQQGTLYFRAMNDISLVIAKKLSARLPFYYGWIVVFAAGTTTFARMAPSTTTLAVFV